MYKPLAQRRWGYYTLPILFGDQLVARIDPKFERQTNTLVICGFWLESTATGRDGAFVEAFGRGVARLMQFLGATKLDARAIVPVGLRKATQAAARAAT